MNCGNMKILHNLCLHFIRQHGQDRKNRIENHAKIPKTKRQKYGMNKTALFKIKLLSILKKNSHEIAGV